MQARFANWVDGLNGDWCISRQRFFGVPFPVWYPIRANGSIDYANVMVAPEPRLPLDRRRTFQTATRPISAASPVDSSAIPTSWTPGRRRRSRRLVTGWERDELIQTHIPDGLAPAGAHIRT
jgi:valyl-tRNA synthetase